jgi:hypothetical protein
MAPNIATGRMAPIGTDASLGLAMGEGVVDPGAREVQMYPLVGGGEYWHFGWTLVWVKVDDAGLDIYHIRNDRMVLYLSMSDADGLNSRILGGVLAPGQPLIFTQEWRVKVWGDGQLQFISRNGFAIETYTDVRQHVCIWSRPADLAKATNQIWQV